MINVFTFRFLDHFFSSFKYTVSSLSFNLLKPYIICSDCFTARLKLSSNDDLLYTTGLLTSHIFPSITKSDVCCLLISLGLINTISLPRLAKKTAVLYSCFSGGTLSAETSIFPITLFMRCILAHCQLFYNHPPDRKNIRVASPRSCLRSSHGYSHAYLKA